MARRFRVYTCTGFGCSAYLVGSNYGQKLFCSAACRQRSYRARKKGESLRHYSKSVTPSQA